MPGVLNKDIFVIVCMVVTVLSFNIANEADNGITQGEIIVKALIRKFPN